MSGRVDLLDLRSYHVALERVVEAPSESGSLGMSVHGTNDLTNSVSTHALDNPLEVSTDWLI